MKIQKFEDVIAWQKAQELAIEIYQRFKHLKDFTFKDQICRAVVSISSNIAEGFDRKTTKEFSYFLHVALGSSSEVKSLLYLSKRLDYISSEDQEELINSCSEVSKVITGLIKSLNRQLTTDN